MQRKAPHLFHIGSRLGLVAGRSLLLLVVALLLSLHATRNVDAQEGSMQIAAVAPVLSYQGRLLDPGTGLPKTDGNYTFAFRVYNVASGGTELWLETKDLAVTNGLFSTLLGDTTPFPANLFDGQNLWLGIKVGADPEATPRQRLAPVAYAMYADNADRLDGKDSSEFVATAGIGSITANAPTRPILTVTQESTHDGILATTNATAAGRAAVSGRAGSAGPTITSAAGVFGTSAAGRGVIGSSTSSTGVFGFSTEAYGLEGQAPGTGSGGVLGTSFGGGAATAGVYGNHTASSGVVYGVRGRTSSTSGRGVFGEAAASTGTTYGVYGASSSTSGRGVYGDATASSGTTFGVYGRSNSSTGYAIYGIGTNAGRFFGNVTVTGSMSKGSGTFKIDHPLDPENKYLSHSFVESPDMMNVYNGNVTLDANGQAWVNLPAYFQALNRDFRYQLTAIGGPGPNLFISDQIANNRFRIAGGSAGLMVSWQVTGIRQDPFANANRVIVEQDKPQNERGSYLHPEAYGVDRSRSLDARLQLLPAETLQVPAQGAQPPASPQTQPDTQ